MDRVDFAKAFDDLAQRFEDIARRPHSRSSHFACDLSQRAISAAKLLEKGAAAGVFDGRLTALWESLGLWKYEDETERLLFFWTMAIGRSWLYELRPEAFRADGPEQDWNHYEAQPGTEYEYSEERDEKGNVVRKNWRLPKGALTCVERRLDNEDAIYRERSRAENYADACRLLAELAREGSNHTPDGAIGTTSECAGQRSRTEMLFIGVAKQLRQNPHLNSVQLGSLLGASSGSVRKTKAWKNRKQLRSGPTGEATGYRTADGTVDGETSSPAAEHMTVYQFWQACKRDGRRRPSTQELAKRLGPNTKLDEARRISQETESLIAPFDEI